MIDNKEEIILVIKRSENKGDGKILASCLGISRKKSGKRPLSENPELLSVVKPTSYVHKWNRNNSYRSRNPDFPGQPCYNHWSHWPSFHINVLKFHPKNTEATSDDILLWNLDVWWNWRQVLGSLTFLRSSSSLYIKYNAWEYSSVFSPRTFCAHINWMSPSSRWIYYMEEGVVPVEAPFLTSCGWIFWTESTVLLSPMHNS